MHIVENLALNCGCKIGKPNIQQVFSSLPFKDYITIDNGEGVKEKSYQFFDCVLRLIKPLLLEHGINVVQVSKNEKDETISGVDFNACHTSFRQKSYLVYHSKLHLTVDSFTSQIAGLYDKKTVFLPSVLFEGNSKPFFISSKNLRTVEPSIDFKPSLFSPEAVKRIDQIKPEDVARQVLELLGIEFDFPYETILLGNGLNSVLVECVPNAYFQLGSDKTINVRLDYLYNEQNLLSLLNLNKCHIITNKIVPINILQTFKSKITRITYVVDSNHDPKFIEAIKKLGIKFSIITYDEDSLNKYKLSYMDYGVIQLKKKYNFDELKKMTVHKDLNINDLYYISNKVYQDNGKTYPGFLGSIQGLDPISLAEKFPNDPIKQLIFKAEDNDFFWRDIESYWLLKKII